MSCQSDPDGRPSPAVVGSGTSAPARLAGRHRPACCSSSGGDRAPSRWRSPGSGSHPFPGATGPRRPDPRLAAPIAHRRRRLAAGVMHFRAQLIVVGDAHLPIVADQRQEELANLLRLDAIVRGETDGVAEVVGSPNFPRPPRQPSPRPRTAGPVRRRARTAARARPDRSGVGARRSVPGSTCLNRARELVAHAFHVRMQGEKLIDDVPQRRDVVEHRIDPRRRLGAEFLGARGSRGGGNHANGQQRREDRNHGSSTHDYRGASTPGSHSYDLSERQPFATHRARSLGRDASPAARAPAAAERDRQC